MIRSKDFRAWKIKQMDTKETIMKYLESARTLKEILNDFSTQLDDELTQQRRKDDLLGK